MRPPLAATISRSITAGALAVIVLTASSAHASSISINFSFTGNDNNAVDAGETAIVGIPSADSVDGAFWNNVLTKSSSPAGNADQFTAATQGGSFITLGDDAGDDAATMTSAGGTFFTQFADATDNTTNRAAQGEAGLMQSFLNLGAGESITISGLGADYTTYGYRVYAFFEINQNRVYSLTLTEGAGGNDTVQTFWTNDTNASDADADEDGLMEWVRSTGTSLATATTDGNYAVFSGFVADSFTITGISSAGARAIISGLQIVAVPAPAALPAGLAMLTLIAARRKRHTR